MDFKETLNLPKTDFPMKADLPKKEKEFLAAWESEKMNGKVGDALAGKPLFILHDGPPYANGHLHMGHALNKILKDIINRVAIKKGKSVNFVPGWDCHGLPIEHQVLKDLGKRRSDLTGMEIRIRCRDSASRFSEIQKGEFIRMGIMGDWDHPYLTMDFDYEAEILKSLARLAEAGRIYKGEKPVLWCGVCETALADAEVEYAMHKSTSVTVLFPEDNPRRKRFFPIWTTTPWTLPANQAVALNPEMTYLILESPGKSTVLEEGSEIVFAEEIANRIRGEEDNPWKDLLSSATLIGKKTGKELLSQTSRLRHPFVKNRTVPLIGGDFVGTDQGTGLVHIAPGHGEEDFELGKKYRLPTETPVNEKGRYGERISEIDPSWVGSKIQETAPLITGIMRKAGTLVFEEIIEHSYPHCWRCKNPVFYRATSQWFLSLSRDDLRKKTLDAIGTVDWIPEKGENRIRGMIETRPDWCLSRQRAWGVPIPAIGCDDCGKSTLSGGFIHEIADRTEREGVDFWFDEGTRSTLVEGKTCPECGGSHLHLEEDILDVWFDSGVSHEAVLKKRHNLKWPADLYLEGSDQHRGWFHSSLLTSVALEGTPPYRSVLTHGFVVDGQGKKMAKTLGNVISPSEIIDKYGADVLRLWTASSDYQEDIRVSAEILENLVDSYRKIRNTFRYMLSNLYDYQVPDQPDESEDPLDRWILSIWERTKQNIEEAYEDRRFAQVIQTLNHLCSISLSAQYFDMIKDRLYAERPEGKTRRGTQHTLHILLEEMISFTHPILPFTTAEISSHAARFRTPLLQDPHLDLFTKEFPKRKTERVSHSLETEFDKFLLVRGSLGRMADDLKKDKIIGSTMELHLEISGDWSRLNPNQRPDDFFETFFIVSAFSSRIGDSTENGKKVLARTPVGELGVNLTLFSAEGEKCQRCWLRKTSTGANPEGLPLCGRCYPIVQSRP